MSKNTKNHVFMEQVDDNVLVYRKDNVQIDNKTTVTVPGGFLLQVVKGSNKTGDTIYPCKDANLQDMLNLSKNELNTDDTYSFYYYKNGAEVMTFNWGEGFNVIDFRIGMGGYFMIKIEQPIILCNKRGSNLITKEDIDKNSELLDCVMRNAKSEVSGMLRLQQTTALDIANSNVDLSDLAKKIERRVDNESLISELGLSFAKITVGWLNAIERQYKQRVRTVIEQQRKQ